MQCGKGKTLHLTVGLDEEWELVFRPLGTKVE
jgi:hypothetical protein